MSEAGRLATKAAEMLRPRLEGLAPETAIVLGSGLGGFADRISTPVRIRYRDIPGFSVPTVAGHGSELVAGKIGRRSVLAQVGRVHLYEGHDAATCAFPVRVFAELGIRVLILTNAAGGIRRSFARGTLMLIADHINLTFRNPLIGAVLPGEERFPDMSDPYDCELRNTAQEVARSRKIRLDEGVYVGLLGPSFETPAEIRMLERLGADAVGMSTVTEVIAARARGLRCIGISTIANLASGISPIQLSHGEVMETGERVQSPLGALLEGIIARL